jgi:hypothetical protein
MSNRRKRRMLVRLALFTFVMGEAGGFYMVSLFWLRHAKSYGDPLMQSLPWICVWRDGRRRAGFLLFRGADLQKIPLLTGGSDHWPV